MSKTTKKRAPARGDRYVSSCGHIAQLTVPLLCNDDDDDIAHFTWGAFILIDEERVAHLEPPYDAMRGTPNVDSQEEAAERGDALLRRLGFVPQI